jgi:hypothetical protein
MDSALYDADSAVLIQCYSCMSAYKSILIDMDSDVTMKEEKIN